MILQYESNNKTIYEESETIALANVYACGKRFEDIFSVIDSIKENLNYSSEEGFTSCTDGLDDESIKSAKMVKVAILSDGKNKEKNRSLLFSEDTEIFLLNSNGKTLRRF